MTDPLKKEEMRSGFLDGLKKLITYSLRKIRQEENQQGVIHFKSLMTYILIKGTGKKSVSKAVSNFQV
jgi:hypothetical protein